MENIGIRIVHWKKLEERKKMMDKQIVHLSKNIKNIEWVDWFDRDTLTWDDIQENYCPLNTVLLRPLTLGEISNGMAHNHILSTVKGINMVIEDDVILKPNFIQNVDKVLEIAPVDWDVIVLGYHFSEPTFVEKEKITLTIAEKSNIHTCCFLIKEKIAERITQHFLFKPFPTTIDHTLCIILPDIDAKVYHVDPWLCFEGSKVGLFDTSFKERGF